MEHDSETVETNTKADAMGEPIDKTEAETEDEIKAKKERASLIIRYNRAGLFTLVRDVLVALLVIVLILQVIRPTVVFEHSMEDTLMPRDYVFLFQQAYTINEIQVGDIVVCESTLLDNRGIPKNLIKRVIGLPGDKIEIKDDAVYRNEERMDEPYVKDGYTAGEVGPLIVPANSYFLLGDNRQVSKDSRSAAIGCILENKIKGKVFFRLFPISQIGRVD